MLMVYAGNEELDAEVSVTTNDHAAAVNETSASTKLDSVGPPARPQPPVCLIFDAKLY